MGRKIARIAIAVGYCGNSKAYRFIHPSTGKVEKRRDVIFKETPGDDTISRSRSQEKQNCLWFPLDEEVGEDWRNDKIEEEPRIDPESSEDEDNYQLAEKGEMEVREEGGEVPLRRSSRPHKPVVRKDFITYLSYDKHSSDPATSEEALKSPEREMWLQAMMNEKKSLIENETFELVNCQQVGKVSSGQTLK